MLRYSLGTLFLVLLYLSVACAALVNANGIWPQIAVSMTLVILAVASLAAVFWRDRARTFAIGFSVTGWLYLLFVFSNFTSVRPYLLTDSATNQLFSAIHEDQVSQYQVVMQAFPTPGAPTSTVQRVVFATPPQPTPPPQLLQPVRSAAAYTYPVPAASPSAAATTTVMPYTFASIGHAIWAVLIAFAGGVTAQLLWTLGNRKDVPDGQQTAT